ncbi:stress responsive A/B barrel domain protein [Aspergillus bombycis]|uniref:Stress responsive A/B barrel domain protein n=1 Tax=Aspergillus bombycis TaxID=109264 RepID=A0A1F8A992_9EURO|nr:stress responsive A/B barrel domain protein [Aspergillus bombycis]OGM48257.1 stress responsive A/B barrel domain protein [Aspergillus bombycis]
MQITHVVLLQFKPDVSAEDKLKVASQVRALRESCLHPETKMPYIVSMKGGCDNSIEGLQSDISHGFVSVFANEQERDYFVTEDQVHLGLVQSVKGYLAKVQVVDFVDEVYA